MRVLPVNCINYQSKTNNLKSMKIQGYQQNPMPVPENPSFKGGKTAAVATAFAVVLGGAALILAAPVAVVAGAVAAGAMGGAALAEDNEPLNDCERYKYTHEN